MGVLSSTAAGLYAELLSFLLGSFGALQSRLVYVDLKVPRTFS